MHSMKSQNEITSYEENNLETEFLGQTIVEAHYLGLQLRELGQIHDFRHHLTASLLGRLLSNWAQAMDSQYLRNTKLYIAVDPSKSQAS